MPLTKSNVRGVYILVLATAKIAFILARAGWSACNINSDEAFLNLFNIGLKDCVRECQLRSACMSLSYSRTRLTCALLPTAEPCTHEPGHTCINIKKSMVPASCSSCNNSTRCEPSNGTCKVTECQKLGVEHGTVTGNIVTVGSRVTVECATFYKLDPASPRVRCETSGTWTGNPRCIPQSECGLPPDAINARAVSYDDVTNKAHYVCTEGLTEGGGDGFDVQCQDDGTWMQVGQRCYKCPDAWHLIDRNCYHTPGPSVTSVYFDAQAYCHNKRGILVELETKPKNDALKEYLRNIFGAHLWWIALSDLDNEGRWKWMETNTIATFTDWVSPPNSGRAQNFACLNAIAGWIEGARNMDCSPLCAMQAT